MIKEMLTKKKELLGNKNQKHHLRSWTSHKPQLSGFCKIKKKNPVPVPILKQQNEPIAKKVDLESWPIEEMNQFIANAWLNSEEYNFAQILHLILFEYVSVDYQHSK